MPLISYLMITHRRHHLLGPVLTYLATQIIPPGWEAELALAYDAGDAVTEKIITEVTAGWAMKVTAVPVPVERQGPKRNAALAATDPTSSYVLMADDDDFHSPQRAAAVIDSHGTARRRWAPRGHTRQLTTVRSTVIREYRRLYLPSGNVVRWCGRGDRGAPRHHIGGIGWNFDRKILIRAGGFADVPRGQFGELQQRLERSRIFDHDLNAMADDTVCLQHGTNIWDREMPALGERVLRHRQLLIGEGHYSQIPDFPSSIAEAIRPLVTDTLPVARSVAST